LARGFESKDVEYQQSEAERRPSREGVPTTEQLKALEHRRTLELSIARAEADLRAARAPQHRHMLEQALQALRERLAQSASR
jgi:hypothetical protein